MNKKMLEIAQQEYQRQVDVWIESQPDKKSVYKQCAKLEKYINQYAKLEKLFKKSQDSSHCPLKRVECMGGKCVEHYKCKNENHYHKRGSNAKEECPTK